MTLTIYSSEPLQSALLTVNGEKILMRRAESDMAREAELVIEKDARCELDMISSREIAGSGPPTMRIKSLPDRPPVVRLLQAGQNIRLNPREIVPLTYDVIDDFGIVALTVRSQVNSLRVVETPIPISGDRRRQDGAVDFDLAAGKLGIGDVISLALVATDTSGQNSASEPLYILVSPRSIDMETHQRIAELLSASQFTALLADELQAAGNDLAEPGAGNEHQFSAYSQASARTNRHLASASEDATLLRQSLYRVTLHTRSKELSQALAVWIDAAQIQADTADDLFRRSDSSAGTVNMFQKRLQHALDESRQLVGEIQIGAHGQEAEAALADQENLRASEHMSPAVGSQGFDRFQ